MANVYEQIRREELTPDLQLLAEICGMDSLRKILESLNGLSFYIPKMTRFERFIIRYLSENPDEKMKETAKKLGVSEQYLNNLSKREMESKFSIMKSGAPRKRCVKN